MDRNLATICLTGKQKFAKRPSYPRSVVARNDIRSVLARNLRLLMNRRQPRWTQTELAKAAKVSQRTVSNMLRGAEIDDISGATLDRIAAVAIVFKLQSWQLTYPDLPEILDDIHGITDVLKGYRLADKDGRAVIHSVAEREAKYQRNNQGPLEAP